MTDQVLRQLQLNGHELKVVEFALIQLSKSISDRNNESYATFRRIKRILQKIEQATLKESI